mmetsp:Transcript_3410/g.7077  ORF Transcript_3410/g.7077 Transcript_3410/m.7077 type:complete len:249 (-) Transcript_3410:1523-2269(-)|eukprot:CAMPEP_0204911604 /NCGR_PEP_ID=MMETSP1397-20131031/9910_1 /ASSEMBLY_ACC=CAM_ASM_000891 /TAXON_ID=49980 /ORGANISM="Climacostomum Climacostomum virens, Strain Stock W-24" /LENGTH=248 /DNA_ID=CAMNT_0052082211 /DNA_START=211 /DNA_END=960 /DNA_ORIENTATION=-
MGAGKTKIKVPPVVQGQILNLTGIKEFDRLFLKGENLLRSIEEAKTALDMLTMDFVKALGAEKQWEMDSDLKVLVNMMLVVFSTRGKGALNQVGLVYMQEPPFIDANQKKLTLSQRKVLETFKLLGHGLVEFPERLEILRAPLTKLAKMVDKFPQQVNEKAQLLKYKMHDKILAVRYTNTNVTKLSESPDIITKLCTAAINNERKIHEVIAETQVPPASDHLVSRGVQAASEGLKKPGLIVAKFWPVG